MTSKWLFGRTMVRVRDRCPPRRESADWVLDSPAVTTGTINRQRPLRSNDPNELMSAVQPWIDNCLLSHKRCVHSVSGKTLNDQHGSKLPTRVLSVKVESDPHAIRLVEPGRLVGRYCALSHCWGAPEKRPFTTTRDNLEDNCRSTGNT